MRLSSLSSFFDSMSTKRREITLEYDNGNCRSSNPRVVWQGARASIMHTYLGPDLIAAASGNRRTTA